MATDIDIRTPDYAGWTAGTVWHAENSMQAGVGNWENRPDLQFTRGDSRVNELGVGRSLLRLCWLVGEATALRPPVSSRDNRILFCCRAPPASAHPACLLSTPPHPRKCPKGACEGEEKAGAITAPAGWAAMIWEDTKSPREGSTARPSFVMREARKFCVTALIAARQVGCGQSRQQQRCECTSRAFRWPYKTARRGTAR